jgi:hypothetical protein
VHRSTAGFPLRIHAPEGRACDPANKDTLRVHVYRWTEAGTDRPGAKQPSFPPGEATRRPATSRPTLGHGIAYAAVVITRKARYLKDERVWDA